ncbi:MAG: ECF transporter S component [Clostridiales bacterium]|nr:ECF transporter S component [Clostridiales bacterium]
MNNQQEIATPDIIADKAVRSQNTLSETKKMTYTAVFAALAVVMKFIGQYLTLTPSFKITLIYMIWLMAAACLGIVRGGLVCFISDILGAFILPQGAINPFVVMGNTLYGVIAGATFKLVPIKNNYLKFLIMGVVCTGLCTCLINSAAIWYGYGYYETMSFGVYFVTFRTMQPIVAAINIALTMPMIPLLKKLKLLPDTKK